jgi:hypothetical protein
MASKKQMFSLSKFFFILRNLLLDYLNEMKQNLNKKVGDHATNVHDNSSSFIFKLFTDLEEIDTERVNKVLFKN